ncbi:MAG: DUF4932 domain-containing protein [Treponema sp.]|jgi:hypothetical protein|nr:DUF4932 domain-containing protein [Treponema sp.]
MEITIDPRIELVAVVQNLCNYWDNLSLRFTNEYLFSSPYKDEMTEYFRRYRSCDIIKLYNSVYEDILDISAFIRLIVCYSNPPELHKIADYYENYGDISSCAFPEKEFIEGLRQFYKNTQFNEFLKRNQIEYKKMREDYGEDEEIEKVGKTIFEYLDIKNKNYTIILSSLVMGGFGISLRMKDNDIKNYMVVSPYNYKNGSYVFGPKNLIKEYLWHEISHTKINNLTKNYAEQIKKHEKTIPEKVVKQGYTNIETILNEYIIRAITLRQFEKQGEKSFMEYLIDDNAKKGFTDVGLIKEFIKENGENENRFMKFDNYEELLNYLLARI